MRAIIWGSVLLLICLCPDRALPNDAGGGDRSDFQDFEELSLESVLDVKVVSAVRHEQTLRQAPNAMTVITAEEIETYGYETLAEALRNLAGMHVSNDHNYEYLGVWGFAPTGDYNTRVLLLVDGHPINDILWSYAGIGTDQPIDLRLVERIEVLRGPGSALYGTNAIFGTINIITRRPGSSGGLALCGGAGSYGYRQGQLAIGTNEDASFGGFLSVSAMTRRGPDLRFREFSGKGSDGWTRGCDDDRYRRAYAAIERGPLTIRGLYAGRTKGIPTAPWGGLFGDRSTETKDRVSFIDATLVRETGRALALSGRSYVHSALLDGVWPWAEEDSSGASPRMVDRDHQEGLSWGVEGRLDWQPSMRHRILTGMEVRNDLYTLDYAREAPSLDVRETVVRLRKRSGFRSAYLQDELQLSPRATATVGGHYDRYPTFGGRFTPRIGLVVEATSHTYLKALYGAGFKAPSSGERFYGDEGVSQAANPNLRPERLRSGEFVLERSWNPGFWTRVSGHLGEVSDLILFTEREADGLTQYQNGGRQRLLGVNLESRFRIAHGVDLRASVTRQDVWAVGTDEWAVNSPRWLAGLGASARILQRKSSVAVETRYVGKRRSRHDQASVPGHVVADLNLLLALPVPGWRASLKVRNLGDLRYADPGGEEHVMSSIVQDGRTWTVGLSRINRQDASSGTAP